VSEVPIAEPVAGAPAAFTTDLACVVCGYNLRGLMPGGRCPECGSPVDRSVHGNLLRYADRGWLEKLLLGVRLMLWGLLLSVLTNVGSNAAVLAGMYPPRAFFIIVGSFVSGLGLAVAILLTTEEPRVALSDEKERLPTVIRACAAAVCLDQILYVVPIASQAVPYWLRIAEAILSSTAVVSYVGKCIYLQRFALRIPHARLARSTRIVMWGLAVCAGSMQALYLVEAIAMGPGGTFSSGPGAGSPAAILRAISLVFDGVMGLGAAGFAIWCVILLFCHQKALREAIAQVRNFEMQIAHG
jgi:hypothetical protein